MKDARTSAWTCSCSTTDGLAINILQDDRAGLGDWDAIRTKLPDGIPGMVRRQEGEREVRHLDRAGDGESQE